MDWKDVAKTVGSIAPAAGGALAGPAGAAVGGVIARALGVPADPQSVASAVEKDPQAALALRKIEFELETALIQGRADVIKAEARSESWLARSWRPLTMLSFVTLIGLHWLGFTPDTLADAHVESVLTIVQYGLTGYVVGRSAEKITKTVSGAGIFEHLKAKR